MNTKSLRKLLVVTLALGLPAALHAEWTNRYPKAEGFGHHIYLEAFELPVLNAGAMDPAPSPSGKQIAFSARGWLWLMDLESHKARRITRSAGIDARPEWSPGGTHLVFIRDSGSQLAIVSLDLKSGKEQVLVDAQAINLDPVFSLDEKFVYYASSQSGQIQLWRVALDTLHREQVTPSSPLHKRLLRRRPLMLAGDSLIVYLGKTDKHDSIELYNTRTHTSTPLLVDSAAAQADMALSPDGRYLVYTWPYDGGYELRLLSIAAPETSVLLSQSQGMPLAPAFGHDGQWVYFAEANDEEHSELKRVSVNGGAAETLAIRAMDWGAPTGTLRIKSSIDGNPAPVRLNVLDGAGHPVIAQTGAVRSEGQNGRVFFYSGGEIELVAPAGPVHIAAVQGFETSEAVQQAVVHANNTTTVDLELKRVWSASENGWYSGDNHLHLNYGGTYRLAPEDLLPAMKGEGVDFAFPQLANLQNRFLQQELWGWSHEQRPVIRFGQEVRSHFLGHVGLIGADKLFWPWIWGPGYPVYGSDDRTNATALRFARANGGLGGYVHPVRARDPLTPDTANSIPIGFVADAVLGEVDLIELACLWSDEIGTAALWHSVLNLGIPLAASGGSDVMTDYYRTMAIGATRVYVKPRTQFNGDSYLAALKEGRSFVSNGPMIEFVVNGKGPGEAVDPVNAMLDWTLNVHSALPFKTVELFVNGVAVKTVDGNPEPGSKSYSGSVEVPAGGWITARVSGTNSGWPAMDSYLFAESSPIWIGKVGSTDPAAARRSAGQLLMALDVAQKNMQAGYGNAPIPDLLAHFAKARKRLQEFAAKNS